MRIISGKYKGKKLSSVKGEKTRPTSDKLKGAIFNVLFSIGGIHSFENMVVLDLFAGTGALGIEAISRGADICYFVDKNRDAIQVIKNNLDMIGASDHAHLILKHFDVGLNILRDMGVKPDIIFMDAPYDKLLTLPAIKNIILNDTYNSNSIIIAEHSSSEEMPEKIEPFNKVSEKFYGEKVLTFYSLN
ncbi:16S rRNA (guanine(966)-N(2))-methyltransferase RsmD [Thermodesulfobacteriota bacterium]